MLLAQHAWAEETAMAAPEPANASGNEPLVPVASAETPRLENSERLLRLVGTIGLSLGGDTVATAYYSNGDSEELKAGGLIYGALGLGLDIPNTPVSLQVLGGFHFDQSTADNGEMTFERNTLDVQIFFRQGNHRFGVGAVQHKAAEYVGKIDGQPDDRATFDDASGLSLEYNYLPMSFNWPFKDSRAGFSVRYVKIDYEAKTYNGATVVNPLPISGNHIAAGVYLYL